MMKRMESYLSTLKGAAIMLSALLCSLLFSCSSPQSEICIVSITLEEEDTRSITASFTPLSTYTVYYRSQYRGTGVSYGAMSETDDFKKLTGNGILLSQGLWEIEAVFKETDCGDTYSPADKEPVASSGLIFINLNTSSIPVSFPEGTDGYLNISSYTLSSVPDSITNLDVDVSLYSYNEATSSFISSSNDISSGVYDKTKKSFSTTKKEALNSGLYYAKVTVTGKVSSSQKTLFTDVIGFSIRGGLTTVVKGVCSHYNISTTSSVVIVPPSNTGTNTENDIRNFKSGNFEDGTTYQLSKNYTMIPDDGYPYDKVIDNNKSVTIDLNGCALNNVQGDNKCYFVVKGNSTLSIINKKTNKNPTISDSSDAGVNNASFVVDGGTLNVGSLESGSVVLKGTPASMISSDTTEVHAPIEISQNGGTVNLCGNSKENEITIEDCVKGIAGVVGKKIDSDLKISIILDYVAIKAKGADGISNYGIYLDGQGRNGTIEIKVGQIGDKKTISTSGSKSSENGIYGYGIYITNFSGKIKITIDDGGSIESSDGYGIYITDTCTGPITIENNGLVKAGSKGQAALYVRGKTEKENKDGELLKETFTYSQTTTQGS